MNLDDIKKFAINEVRNGNVTLHKEYLNDILYFINKKDIYQLKQFEVNSYYLPEKNYYNQIISRLETYLSS